MLQVYTTIYAAAEYLHCAGTRISASKSFPPFTRSRYIKQAPTSYTGLEHEPPREKKGMVICFLVTTAVLGRSYYITRGYGEAVFTRVTESLPHIFRFSLRNTLIMS